MLSRATGNIYDLGYRRYDGPRLGRRHAIWVLWLHRLRGCFGLGRPASSKIFPIALAIIVTACTLLYRAFRRHGWL